MVSATQKAGILCQLKKTLQLQTLTSTIINYPPQLLWSWSTNKQVPNHHLSVAEGGRVCWQRIGTRVHTGLRDTNLSTGCITGTTSITFQAETLNLGTQQMQVRVLRTQNASKWILQYFFVRGFPITTTFGFLWFSCLNSNQETTYDCMTARLPMLQVVWLRSIKSCCQMRGVPLIELAVFSP